MFVKLLSVFLFLAAVSASGQSALSPSPLPKIQLFDNNGKPLSGGLVYTYQAGTTTPLTTYADGNGGTPNTNPVVLDSAGRASIWLSPVKYKIVVQDRNGVQIYSVDNVPGGGNFLSLSGGTVDGDLTVTGNSTLNNLTVTGTCTGCGTGGGGGSGGDGSFTSITSSGTIQSTANGTNIAFQTRDLTQQTLTTPFQVNGQGDISSAGNTNITGWITTHTWLGLPATNSEPTTTPGGGFTALAYKGGSTFWYYDTTAAAWKTADIAGGGGGSGNPVFSSVTASGVFKARVNSPNIAFQVSTVDSNGNETGPTPLQIDGGGNISAAGNANITGYVTTHTWLGMPVTGSTPATAPGTGFSALVYKGGSEFWYYNTTAASWQSFDAAVVGGGVTSVNGFSGSVTVAGTTNQITVTNTPTPNTATLSLPQDINNTATVTFNDLVLNDTATNTLSMPNGFIATKGLAATSTNFDSIQTTGGFKAALGITLDQGAYMKGYGTSGSLNAPSASYGGLAYKTGTHYWVWNGTTWVDIDFSTVGGGVTTLAGTVHQVNVNQATGAVQLSTPQDIDVSSNPTFNALTISSSATNALQLPSGFITAKGLVATATNFDSIQTAGGFKGLSLSLFGTTSPGVSQAGAGTIYFDSAANRFRVSQNAGAYTDLLGAAAGVGTVNSLSGTVTIVGVANQIGVQTIAGNQIQIFAPQAIATTSNPTFAGVIANGAFNSAVNGSTIAFQVSNTGGATPFQVNGTGFVSASGMNITNGNLDVIPGGSGGGAIRARIGYYAGTLPNATIDSSGNASFANLTVTGTCTGCSGSSTTVNGFSGAVTVAGTANQVGIINQGNGFRLFLPQSVDGTASPTFTGLLLTGSGANQLNLPNGSAIAQGYVATSSAFNSIQSAGGISLTGGANAQLTMNGTAVIDGSLNGHFAQVSASSTISTGGGIIATGGVSAAGFNPSSGGFGQTSTVSATCNVNGTNFPVTFNSSFSAIRFGGGSMIGLQ